MRKTILLSLLFLASCATWHYAPPAGASEHTIYKDRSECMAQGGDAARGLPAYKAEHVRKDTYIYCLRDRGWKVEKK